MSNPTTTTEVDIESIQAAYVVAWADRDVDRIVSMHATDTQFWMHINEQPITGLAAVHDAFTKIFDDYADFRFTTYRIIHGPQHWVLDWALETSARASDGSLRPLRWDCLDIVTVNDNGKVVRKDTFVDYPQAEAAMQALT